MPIFERHVELPVSAEAAYAWHARDGALERLAPPGLRIVQSEGSFETRRLVMQPGPWQPVWQIAHEDV